MKFSASWRRRRRQLPRSMLKVCRSQRGPPAPQRLITFTKAASDEGRVLSFSEAADLLKVTRVTVYAWIETKRRLAWRATRRGVLLPAALFMGPGELTPGVGRASQ